MKKKRGIPIDQDKVKKKFIQSLSDYVLYNFEFIIGSGRWAVVKVNGYIELRHLCKSSTGYLYPHDPENGSCKHIPPKILQNVYKLIKQ